LLDSLPPLPPHSRHLVHLLLGLVELIRQFLNSSNEVLLLLDQTGNVVLLVRNTPLNTDQGSTVITRIAHLLLQLRPKSLPLRLQLLHRLLHLL
jgi:hypothetical protein